MSTRLNPYLGFKDNAREAMTFYHGVFGGELHINTFGEYHASEDPSEDDKVMHAQLEGDNGIVFMAADTPSSMPFDGGSSISISLSGDDDEQLRGYWSGLSEGGTVTVALEKQMWGDVFGMCTDTFGVTWMVNISEPAADG